MEKKTLKILEYNKIIKMLAEQASSEMTKKVISELTPFDDARLIKEKQNETTEAVRLIKNKGPLPVGGFYDIKDIVSLARKGATLSMSHLLKILANMKTADRIVSFLKGDIPDIPAIMSIAELITIHRDLEKEIERCIISEDEMADNASSELRSIRRNISRQNDAVKNRINRILNSGENKKILQDSIVTVRNGRYVIPVKQEHRGRIPGIVHDQSNSKATLFIEPQPIVELNNELRQLELDEQAEINRILKEFSERVCEIHHDLKNNQDLMVQLELFMAKGMLSVGMNGEEPNISKEGIMDIKGARHPLIGKEEVVPIDIRIGEGYNTLVITGPNTGGKTVTLKTAGLFALMAQTGLHIPSYPGSTIPVYQDIFADIGDEQSIEQSLSTFSSHMRNIVSITQKADSESLILLDELGAGTDPTEGAALAIAVLEELKKKGSEVIATTHYNELKKFAISADGVENASMEFDVDTLSPTYKLNIGVPGKSNAFEISRKLGLSSDIIKRAGELIQGSDMAFEEVIASLEEEKRKVEEERDEAIMLGIEIKRRKEELDEKIKKFEVRKEKELEKAKEQAREIVREAKQTVEEVKEELKEITKIENSGQRTTRFDESRKKLRELEKKNRSTVKIANNANPLDANLLRVKDRVKILTLDQNGEIVSLPDDKGNLQVQIGIMKIDVNIKDIMLIEGDISKKRESRKNGGYGRMYRNKAKSISPSLDVRGKNLDDAVMDVEKYIDDAFISGLSEITIIHGRGEGILRKGIQQSLRRNKNVESFRKGAYQEGGEGVTVVKLKV